MTMDEKIKFLGDLYRRAQKADDARLAGVAEAAINDAMSAEAAMARMSVAEGVLAEVFSVDKDSAK